MFQSVRTLDRLSVREDLFFTMCSIISGVTGSLLFGIDSQRLTSRSTLLMYDDLLPYISSWGSSRCAAIEKDAAARRYPLIVPDFMALHRIVLLLARSAAYRARTKFLSLLFRVDSTASGNLWRRTNFSQCAWREQNVLAAASWLGPGRSPRTRLDKSPREALDSVGNDDKS